MSSKDKCKTKKKRRTCNFIYDFVKVTGAIPALIWMRPKIIYLNKRPKIKGGFLAAVNHVGFTDPIVVHCVFWRRRLNCIATKNLYNTKLKRFFFNQMHCIMVDKDNFNMSTFYTVCERLQENKAVVIFPEGQVNEKAEGVMPFKAGAILMACRANKPIVPVYINKINKWWQRRVAVVGDPVEINFDGRLPSMKEVETINLQLQQREEELKARYDKYVKDKR
ncbi:MAG: lysophospholipid acyltransferase family protein [Candidatus Coproplasma sp.]